MNLYSPLVKRKRSHFIDPFLVEIPVSDPQRPAPGILAVQYPRGSMITYIALLQAVNVGGTGKLPMADLEKLCTKAGFSGVQTYIASGNVVFASNLPAAKVQTQLSEQLLSYAGKAVGVFIRTAAELRAVAQRNPFLDKEPKLAYVHFLDGKPAADALKNCRNRAQEQIHLGLREIYAYYPVGMGKSKLQIPAARLSTARSMNTVKKLVEMANQH